MRTSITTYTSRFARALVALAFIAATLTPLVWQKVYADGDVVDEIHYSFGENADEVVFNWRGAETLLEYGPTTAYGSQATAGTSAITPWDISGPFREVKLAGLTPNTTYHYRVGATGLDHTFKTRATGDFKWVDIGDSVTSACSTYMTAMHQLITDQQPDVVTHGGDISIMNDCGLPAIHAYYTDQEVWSHTAAFQPVWGNHEYGQPTANAPAGTPRDSLANYKGRSYVTNAQTVPNDTLTKTGHPGCGSEIGSTTNTCRGEDWGWFIQGKVMFISYPEPWTNAYSDWQTKAGAIMANAQADPNIDFIVTYGHRPAYTSSGEGPNLTLRAAVEALAATYSPTASNPNGKYVLSVGHHAHNQEVFAPINGLTHITNAAGGQGFTNWTNVDPNSVYRLRHFSILSGQYDESDRKLTINIVCGADGNVIKDQCTYGQTMYSLSFQRPSTQAALTNTLNDGVSTLEVGQQSTYTATVTNQVTGTTAPGVNLSMTVPAGMSVVNADGGTVNGSTISWSLGNVVAGTPASKQVTLQLDTAQANDPVTVSTAVTASDASCQQATSDCDASDTNTATVTPTVVQWVTNQSVETDLTGWTGKYGGNVNVDVSRSNEQAHSGSYSIKITGLAAASNHSSGFNDNPRHVLNAVAGKTYTGSVWVKPGGVSQSFTLRLREWNGSTLVTDQKVTVTPTTTDWQQVTVPLTAAQNGTQLAFAVYGNDVDAGEYLYADDMSLTSPN